MSWRCCGPDSGSRILFFCFYGIGSIFDIFFFTLWDLPFLFSLVSSVASYYGLECVQYKLWGLLLHELPLLLL